MTLRLLIIDGNTAEADDRDVAFGGRRTGEQYASVLASLRRDVSCDIVHPARATEGLAPAAKLSDYDGVAWTGSSLNIYNDTPAVRRQIELSRAVFEAGVPQFGSCWGLQVAAVAAGGEVRANPRGRELGIAKAITPLGEGETHPMLEGKRVPYEAIAVHLDEVVTMPPQSKHLAGNAMSKVQAAEIRYRAGIFWGVQYHPEYDFNQIAAVVRRYGPVLVDTRFFADMEALNRYVADLRALQVDPTRADIIERYGLNDDVLLPERRQLELRRWLECLVVPYAAARA
jgi:GMP synthase (glutamine-hydrolysing)